MDTVVQLVVGVGNCQLVLHVVVLCPVVEAVAQAVQQMALVAVVEPE